MFCPECGQAQTKQSQEEDPQAVGAVSAPTEGIVAAKDADVEPSQTATAVAEKPPTPELERKVTKPASDGSRRKVPEQTPMISKPVKHEKARERLHRASAVTRDVLADNVRRVEKIRTVSTELFEEASYDPSLRFVLVALALFVLFVVLLVLSKIMG